MRVVCLHAGLTVDPVVTVRLVKSGFTVPRRFVRGAVESVAVLTGRVFRSRVEVPPGQLFWWSGPCALEIGRVVALEEAVPCRGYQWLWRPTPDVEARVRAQVDVEALLLSGGEA